MAPEQAMGAAIDHQADLYAIGVILYEMLSGAPPFVGPNYATVIGKLLTTPPTNLLSIQPHLPPRLVAAAHKALEKEPHDRFPSADAFLAALPSDKAPSHAELAGTVGIDSMQLRAVATSTAQNAALAHHAPKKGAPAWLFALGGIVIAGGAVGGYVALHKNSDTPAASAAAPTVAPAADPPKQPVVTPAQDAPKPPPPEPAKPTVGKLEIKSTPTGATVAIDKNPAGQTPLEIVLPGGKHHIHIELAKYGAVDDDEDIVVGEKTSILIPLQPLATSHVGSAPPRVVPQVQHTVVPIVKQTPPEPPKVEETPKPPPPTPHNDTTTKPGTKPNPYD
jgi:serine/threonine-protein kinase